MGIRDYIMLIIGYGCVPLALYSAFHGVLAYCVISFLSPQALAWNTDVKAARIQFVVMIAVLLRVLVSKGPWVRLRGPAALFMVLWVVFGLSTVASLHPEISQEAFIKFSKMAVAILLITGFVRSRSQVKIIMVILALCAGIWGAKYGLSFVIGGGGSTALGGPLGYDNNDTALFMAMGIPMLVFCAGDVKNRWGRRVLYMAAALTVPGVILTSSRGGFLAMGVAVAVTLWLRTGTWKAAVLIAIVVPIVMAIIPARQMTRYETVETYQEDGSAMSRVYAWRTCAAMGAERPLTGVGFGQGAYLKEYDRYKDQGNPHDNARAAHSVWFSVLAETGYLGLAVYISVLVLALMRGWSVVKIGKAMGDEGQWAVNYAKGIQCALITFAVGGSFLSQAGFEYVFGIVMMTIPLKEAVRKAAESPLEQAEPDMSLALAS